MNEQLDSAFSGVSVLKKEKKVLLKKYHCITEMTPYRSSLWSLKRISSRSFSGFWGMINNAGRSTPIGPTEWMQLEDFKKLLDVNLIGLIEVTLKFLPLLKKAQGSVVNVSSIQGRLSPQWRRLLSIQVWCGGLL
uniref:Uncharacterized protein n=1 Tax=Hucho hucho TaxID=62062 RepID=A0A4W5QT63_9TELE